jgi:predicted DNA-binding protein (UPF0251 family)
MARVIDGTKVASHGLFYMEGAGGSNVEVADAEAAALRAEDAAALRLEDAAALRLEDAAALRLEDERHQAVSPWKKREAKRGRVAVPWRQSATATLKTLSAMFEES